MRSLSLILLACSLSAQSFHPGKPWLDTAGKPIQAHGGGILLYSGVYYWYGEDKTLGNFNKTGISCYSSRDLYTWKHEGVVLPKAAMPDDFRDSGVVERPKVIYNPTTGKFVMWMHLDDFSYSVASAGVATSDRPAGPFRFLRSFRPIRHDFGYPMIDRAHQAEMGSTFRDMNLFVDDDGRAYVFYAAEGNPTMYVARLNADFTGVETPAQLGVTWQRILAGQSREAPTPFKYRGTYYLITSGTTGWNPNPASYATADRIFGPWTVHGNPCTGAGAETTFDSQSTYVLPAPGNNPGAFIYLGDRWLKDNLADSRYVWLPFRIREDGSFSLTWRDEWSLADFPRVP
jgi:beta-xylosidase